MSLATLPAFGSDGSVHVVVESPRGSTVKLKYDADLDAFTLSQPLIEGLFEQPLTVNWAAEIGQ